MKKLKRVLLVILIGVIGTLPNENFIHALFLSFTIGVLLIPYLGLVIGSSDIFVHTPI